MGTGNGRRMYRISYTRGQCQLAAARQRKRSVSSKVFARYTCKFTDCFAELCALQRRAEFDN